MPLGVVIDRSEVERFDSLPGGLQLPVIVKPNREGSTLGVFVVKSREDFKPALREASQ